MGEILDSEAMLREAETDPRIEVAGEPEAYRFDENGNLF